jgi:tetratricopeptide (TPR) repeat protein
MTSTPTIALSVLLASAAAAAVSLTMRPAAETAPKDATAGLQAEVDSLRHTQATLQQELERLRAAPPIAAPVAAGPQRVAATVDDQQIAKAVEAYLQKRGGAAGPGEAKASATFDLEADFDKLSGTNFWGNGEMWKRAFAAGRMDEVIAKYEALAQANPSDVDTQMDLARAYMAYLQMDQSKWQLSMKADKVFDDVLTLDNTHWEARFTKAVSYTFYPDFLGKKKDAIANFETLVQQQELQPVQADQAQTYLYLGNLLEQSDPKRAREMWQKGAKRHPDNAELRKKLAP